MSYDLTPGIPTIKRPEHLARKDRGERASGVYAYITLSMDGVKYIWDLRDESDKQIAYGYGSGETMAKMAAMGNGATFFVSEF